MFKFVGNFLSRIGGSETERHYLREADKAADGFRDVPDDEPPYGGEVQDTNIELVEFHGSSTDVEWMTFNHDTGEVIIQFLEHGKRDRVYSYLGMSHDEFEALARGDGPFPNDRSPYYLKDESVGQHVNYYIRNDHNDDRYDYKHEQGF